MAKIYDTTSGQSFNADDKEIFNLLRDNPNYSLDKAEKFSIVENGEVKKVSSSDIYQKLSVHPLDRPRILNEKEAELYPYKGGVATAKAFGEGLLDSAFLKKPLGKLLGNEKEQALRQEANLLASTAGEMVGIGAQILAPVPKVGLGNTLKYLPAKGIAKGAEKIAEKITFGGVGNLRNKIIKEGAENSLFGLGYSTANAVENQFYTDQELNAESTLSNIGHGALLDFAIGGAVPLVGGGLRKAYDAGKNAYSKIESGAHKALSESVQNAQVLYPELLPTTRINLRKLGQEDVDKVAYSQEERNRLNQYKEDRKNLNKELPSYVNSAEDYINLKDGKDHWLADDGSVTAKVDKNYYKDGEMIEMLDISDPHQIAQHLEDNGLFLKDIRLDPISNTVNTVDTVLSPDEIRRYGVGNAILNKRKAEFDLLDRSLRDLESQEVKALQNATAEELAQINQEKMKRKTDFKETQEYKELKSDYNRIVSPDMEKLASYESRHHYLNEQIENTAKRENFASEKNSDVTLSEQTRNAELVKSLEKEKIDLENIKNTEFEDNLEVGLNKDTVKRSNIVDKEASISTLENELNDSNILLEALKKSDKLGQKEMFKKEMKRKLDYLQDQKKSLLEKHADLSDMISVHGELFKIQTKEIMKQRQQELNEIIKIYKDRKLDAVAKQEQIKQLIEKNHKWFNSQRHLNNSESERFWGAYRRYQQSLEDKALKVGDRIYVKNKNLDRLAIDHTSSQFKVKRNTNAVEKANSVFDFAGLSGSKRQKILERGSGLYSRVADRLKSIYDQINHSGASDSTPIPVRAMKYKWNQSKYGKIRDLVETEKESVGKNIAVNVERFIRKYPDTFIDVEGIANQMKANLKKALSINDKLLDLHEVTYAKSLDDIERIRRSLITLDEYGNSVKTLWEFRKALDSEIKWTKSVDDLSRQDFLRQARGFIENTIEKTMLKNDVAMGNLYKNLKNNYQELSEVLNIVNLSSIKKEDVVNQVISGVIREKRFMGALTGFTMAGPIGAGVGYVAGKAMDSAQAYKMLHAMEQIDSTVKHTKLAKDAGRGLVLPDKFVQKSLTGINFQDKEEKQKFHDKIAKKFEKYSSSDALIDNVLESNPHLSMVDEDYVSNIATKTTALNNYLLGLKQNKIGGYERNISRYEMEMVAKKAYWALNPSENMRMLKNGISSAEQIEALKKVYPKTYQLIVDSAMETLSENKITNLEKMRLYSVLGLSDMPSLDNIGQVKTAQVGQKEKQKALSQKMNGGNIRADQTNATIASGPLQ